MRDSLRLYCQYIAISVRAQMQYKASFVMISLGGFLGNASEFCGVWALFDRFHGLRGWSLPEAALLYGMVGVSFAISEAVARGFDVFPNMIKAGDFDRLLLRPRSTTLQLIGQELQLMRVGRLTQGLIVLVWAASKLGVVWSPAKLALLASAILGGAAVFSGLFIIQATMAFWTVEGLEILNTVTYGGVETAQYPMSVYRPWFRRFFTYVIPLACINYFPSLAILGRPDSSGAPALLHWLSPLVGFAFLWVTLRLWRFGVRHYCSTGS